MDDGNGNVSLSTVTYKVINNQTNLLNQRYAATTATGQATLVPPTGTKPFVRAKLVDANGVELPNVGGNYNTTVNGYLRLETTSGDYFLAVDPMNSREEGQPNATPPNHGTLRDFSYFFELNNFFKSNAPTPTGDTLKNSAINLAVDSRLISDPNQISLGRLTQTPRPSDTSLPPFYTYGREIGDNSTIQDLAQLGLTSVSFNSAGTLPSTAVPFNQYIGQILGNVAADNTSLSSDLDNQQSLMDGFTQRANAVSGVNLDEELGNTVLYQSAYTATTRIITIVNQLFDDLLQAV